jgi:DnaK suppressor protein
MDLAEQQGFVGLIRERLEEIETHLSEGESDREAISPDKAIGRLSRLDAMQMQQMALAGKRRLEEERRGLEAALKRIDSGSYGRCQLCGKAIARERLEIQLTAISCVPCLEKAGRR